jgi:hypothetical protein
MAPGHQSSITNGFLDISDPLYRIYVTTSVRALAMIHRFLAFVETGFFDEQQTPKRKS